MNSDPLQGAGIVITRPTDRAAALCRRVAAAGADVLSFPTLEIQPLAEPAVPSADAHFDWIIFTSVPAVQFGLSLLEPWLPTARVAAIGNATAEALYLAGIEPAAVPPLQQQESEGLIALPDFADIEGKQILIVRGHGGRDLLRREFTERGAQVDLAEVYARRMPAQTTEALMDWWHQQRLNAIVVSSAAGLENLHTMLDDEGRRFLAETQLVVPAARMIKLAQQFGIQREPVVASGASDEALLEALETWWQGHRQDSP